MKKVAILLSSYNGEHHIEEQIESIKKQTYSNWELYVRDDGSTDRTVEIVEEQMKSDNRIHLIEDNNGNLRVIKSFLALLEQVESDYYMFCDQDDYWLDFKVEKTVNKMLEMESVKISPYAVHTDLIVVDQELKLINPSMFDLQKMTATNDKINQLLVQNDITGCTLMVNEAMKQKVKYHKDIAMHDWWIGLIATSFGKIGFINVSTIKYRQHGNNTVGAKKYGISYLMDRLKDNKRTLKLLNQNFKQGKAFNEVYGSELTKKQVEIVSSYAKIPYVSWLNRIKIINKYEFKKNNFSRNLIFFILILFFNKEIKNK